MTIYRGERDGCGFVLASTFVGLVAILSILLLSFLVGTGIGIIVREVVPMFEVRPTWAGFGQALLILLVGVISFIVGSRVFRYFEED